MYAGLRAAGKKADLSLVVADQPAAAAGVFTLNVMCAAPVTYCKDVLAKKGAVKAVRTRIVRCVWFFVKPRPRRLGDAARQRAGRGLSSTQARPQRSPAARGNRR